MDKLENIGFYTLDDNRAMNTSVVSPMWRCELILTDRCNFKCPYCRGIEGFSGDLSFEDAKDMVQKWIDGGLKNVRFSGGEPTLWKRLNDLVLFSKRGGIQRIAVSSNGFSDIGLYRELFESGVNDFSISLDACCSSVGDMMSGGIKGSWEKVVKNIKEISTWTYVTVGVVMDDKNIHEVNEISEFANSLGVSDIRILSAAQWNDKEKFKNICKRQDILNSNPILKYRVNNWNNGRNVRGISASDCHKCWLMLDDMVVMDNEHYPCVIYMREKGKAIGSIIGKTIQEIRQERYNFIMTHDSFSDPICKKNCLDVCVDYNNKVEVFRGYKITGECPA